MGSTPVSQTHLKRLIVGQKACHGNAQKYSPECKRKAVEMTRVAGITVSQVAQELGINGSCWNDGKVSWRRRARRHSKTRVDR